MNTILPDQVLDQMVCSECSKYLSVLPVHAYPNRTTRCGRCIKEVDNGALSQVNKIFPSMLFKCVNRYEGCNSLLLPSQVEEHKKNCVSKTLENCPLCPKSNMPPYMMLEHFKRNHKYYFLKKPVFQIDATLDSDKYYLYCAENMIFLLNVSVDTVNSKLFLGNKFVGPQDLAKTISQQFRILDCLLHMTTELQPFDTFLKRKFEFSMGELKKMNTIFCELILNFDDVQFGKIQVEKKDKLSMNYMTNNCFSRKLYLSPKFKELLSGKLSICGTYIIVNGFKIPIFCSFCGTYLYSKTFYSNKNCSEPTICCNSCINNVSQSCSNGHKLCAILLENKYYLSIKAFCKWKCGQHFNGIDLYAHEEDCINREPIPNCPVENCTTVDIKNFSKLKTHFKTHENTILLPYWDSKYWLCFLSTNDFYVYLDHVTVIFCESEGKIKLKKVIKNDKSKFKIFVNNVQIPLIENIEIRRDVPMEIRVIQDFVEIRVIQDFVVKCKN